MKIPKNRVVIEKLFGEDVFHAHADGEHRTDLCGFDFIEVKKRLKEQFPGRKILFFKWPFPEWQ